jgi:hypothetical protein
MAGGSIPGSTRIPTGLKNQEISLSVLEAAALVCSVVGIYLLVVRPDSERRFQVGAKAVPVLFGAGALLAAFGLVLLLCVGTWPAAWWPWENSRLASERPPGDSPTPIELWLESPGFWMAGFLAIGGAAGVVIARSASTFRMSATVAALSSTILLGVASDWIGAGILSAIGLAFAWRSFNATPGEPDEATGKAACLERAPRGEPLLATAICVLLAWGLVQGLHHSATNEAGPLVATSDAGPALPRPVREKTREANAKRDGQNDRQSEVWLLGITVGVILVTGVVGGAVSLPGSRNTSQDGITESLDK